MNDGKDKVWSLYCNINSLKTLGKSKSNILEVLTTCFEEPAEEITEISTPGAMDF